MDKQDQVQVDSLKTELTVLKRTVQALSIQLKHLTRENVRIKHDARLMRSQISVIDSRTRGG